MPACSVERPLGHSLHSFGSGFRVLGSRITSMGFEGFRVQDKGLGRTVGGRPHLLAGLIGGRKN